MIDTKKRKFWKFLLLGGGALAMSKVLRSAGFGFFDDNKDENLLNGFKTKESQEGLAVYDHEGNQIMIFDKGK